MPLMTYSQFVDLSLLQVNFEKEPRERYIQLLGYDKTDLAEKVCTIIRITALDQIFHHLDMVLGLFKVVRDPCQR